MKQKLRLFIVTLILSATTGCMLLSLGGEAIRGMSEDIEFTETPGFKFTDLKGKILGIFTSTTGAGRGGEGGVYSDMIATELIKKGFDARVVAETSRQAYQDIHVLIRANLDIAMSTSTFGAITGGEFGKFGVKEFAIKGTDPQSGKVLFIVTGSYGKVKMASEMAKDFAEALKKKAL